jgi:hypothetical protein
MTTPLMLLASASSPHFSQYPADSDSSPSIMVEPWEKKCTGVNSGRFSVRMERIRTLARAKILTDFRHYGLLFYLLYQMPRISFQVEGEGRDIDPVSKR